jgi:hypothetical protein
MVPGMLASRQALVKEMLNRQVEADEVCAKVLTAKVLADCDGSVTFFNDTAGCSGRSAADGEL